MVSRMCLDQSRSGLEWGEAGWAAHIASVKDLYQKRRDAFIAAAERHLSGLADWVVPTAGMFCWFQLRGVKDSKSALRLSPRSLWRYLYKHFKLLRKLVRASLPRRKTKQA